MLSYVVNLPCKFHIRKNCSAYSVWYFSLLYSSYQPSGNFQQKALFHHRSDRLKSEVLILREYLKTSFTQTCVLTYYNGCLEGNQKKENVRLKLVMLVFNHQISRESTNLKKNVPINILFSCTQILSGNFHNVHIYISHWNIGNKIDVVPHLAQIFKSCFLG